MMATASIQSLQTAVTNYEVHIKQISELHQQTQQCLDEIQDLINVEEQTPFHLQNLPQFDFAKRLPCVLFIGSQNCGKSTLLNVFLERAKLLPVHETPCTCRIVRVLYSKTNYARVIDTDRNELDWKEFRKNVPRKFVVLRDAQREEGTHLQCIVEVGLNHPLLECGIELIDSPGRNENAALDHVVEEFVEKGVVPLIVYVIDGNSHIRKKDRETIRDLQDKFPNVSQVFVCSKVDKVKNADLNDNKDEQDVDEDMTDYKDPSQELIELAMEKKKEVFRQLKEASFLGSEDDLDSSLNFHGVSARNVERARRKCRQNHDTRCFDRFQCAILQKLENALKKDSKKALNNLLSAQEMILLSAVNTRKSLSHTANVIPTVCDQALKTELSIFQTTLQLSFKSLEIKETIRRNLEQLSADFMDEGEHYQLADKGTVMKEYKTITESAKIDPELLKQVRVEELLVVEFTSFIKGAILDKTFNVLKVTIHGVLREGLSQAVGELIKLTQSVRNPLIGRLVKRIFGASSESQEDVNSFLKLHMILDGLLDSVDGAVNSTLRREISGPLSEFSVSDVGNNPRPRDMHWRRKVVQTLLSKLDYGHVADRVIETCDESLLKLHKLFRETVESYRALNTILESDKLTLTVEKLRSNYVPRVAELAVRGHAIRYAIERGPPILGEHIQSTAHGRILSCSSRQWFCGKDEAVVKVFTKSEVGPDVWHQTMIDCLHSLDVNEKLGRCCANHLQLFGWYFPDPDQFYIVMEKAQCDLLTALKGGLSWERRKIVAVDVAKGLEALHDVEYVYQDLKPQNVMLTADGTAKLNLAKPEKPFEKTQLGLPFHISPDMYKDHGKDRSKNTFDIYAFGSLLWVLCEGSGTNQPKVYSHCQDKEAIKFAICDNGIKPERPPGTPNAWWDLMSACWALKFNIKSLLEKLRNLDTPN